MGKYLKLFETTAAYEAAESSLILPNVSLTVDNNTVHYNPYAEPIETRLVTKYNVTSTSSPTALRTPYEQNIFKSMEIDGVMLDELVTEYTFDSIGVHTVKYELYDETKLGKQAPVFYSGNLVECIIPDSVTNIGENAFNDCSGLTSVTIGSSVTSIGNQGFYNCNGLTNVTIPESVTSIGNHAFGQCYNLTSVIIGSGVTSVGGGAFASCSSLTSCTIGSGVTSIDSYAFGNCSNLISITSLATTAPTINSDAFRDVKTGGTLYVPNGSSGYDVWMGTGDYYLGKYNWTKVEQ